MFSHLSLNKHKCTERDILKSKLHFKDVALCLMACDKSNNESELWQWGWPPRCNCDGVMAIQSKVVTNSQSDSALLLCAITISSILTLLSHRPTSFLAWTKIWPRFPDKVTLENTKQVQLWATLCIIWVKNVLVKELLDTLLLSQMLA